MGEDDVRKFVIRRELPAKDGKKAKTKAPKIQRLVTPVALQRKRHIKAVKMAKAEKAKKEAAAYERLLAKRREEATKASRASKAASLAHPATDVITYRAIFFGRDPLIGSVF